MKSFENNTTYPPARKTDIPYGEKMDYYCHLVADRRTLLFSSIMRGVDENVSLLSITCRLSVLKNEKMLVV